MGTPHFGQTGAVEGSAGQKVAAAVSPGKALNFTVDVWAESQREGCSKARCELNWPYPDRGRGPIVTMITGDTWTAETHKGLSQLPL